MDRANPVDSAYLTPRSVDVDPVDFEDGCFQAARRVVGRTALVSRRLGPDAEVVPAALDDASALVIRYVFVARPVQSGCDANLPSVGGFDDDDLIADRVGRDDSLEARELAPVNG